MLFGVLLKDSMNTITFLLAARLCALKIKITIKLKKKKKTQMKLVSILRLLSRLF